MIFKYKILYPCRRSGRRRNGAGSRSGTLRKGAGVEAVKDLWEKSGMKTNGRKLLIDSEDEGRLNPGEGQHNLGYESDLSELSVPRLGPLVGGRRVRRNGSQSSSTTLESGDGPNSKPRLVRSDTGGSWELRGAAGDSVDLDRVNLEDETDSRHVRDGFNKNSRRRKNLYFIMNHSKSLPFLEIYISVLFSIETLP